MLGDVTQTSGQTPIEIPAPVDAFATVSIGTWQISVWSQFKSVDTQIYRSPKIAVTPASNSSGKRAIITIITPCYHQLSVLTGWDQTSTKAGCLGPSTNAPPPGSKFGALDSSRAAMLGKSMAPYFHWWIFDDWAAIFGFFDSLGPPTPPTTAFPSIIYPEYLFIATWHISLAHLFWNPSLVHAFAGLIGMIDTHSSPPQPHPPIPRYLSNWDQKKEQKLPIIPKFPRCPQISPDFPRYSEMFRDVPRCFKIPGSDDCAVIMGNVTMGLGGTCNRD